MAHDTSPEAAANAGIYQALDPTSRRIRLLELLPGRWTDPLSCRMFVVSLDDNPYYEALSYAWGDPDFCRPISINGAPHRITKNLDAALRRIRQPNGLRIMWVDALCIDQANFRERTHQVNMMGSIFRHTSEALLFVGDYDEGRLLPTTNLEGCSGTHLTRLEVVRAISFISKMADDHHIAGSQAEILSDAFARSLESIEKLFNLPWWSRMWTIQESLLPPRATFVCGSMCVPWTMFWTAALNIRKHYHSCCQFSRNESEPIHPLLLKMKSVSFLRELLLEETTPDLPKIIELFRHRQASDPRDKVFALLGLLRPNEDAPFMDADYSLELPQVYESLVVRSIKFMGDLSPLLQIQEPVRRPDLPSWVPDWTAEVDEKNSDLERQHIYMYRYFDASGGTVPTIYPSPESVLALKGAEVDQVTMVGSYNSIPHRPSVMRVIEQWKELLDYESIKHHQYPGVGTYADAFWRVLVNDITAVEGETERSGVAAKRRTVPGDYDKFLRDFWAPLRLFGFSYTRVRLGRFFITKKGYIGIGPRDMEVEDGVHILVGGKVPFILRRTESQGPYPSFRYIGHAYVHGIMDGEAMQNPDSQPEMLWLV